jgi:asparagine synthase (glutamine-hydrolysing)
MCGIAGFVESAFHSQFDSCAARLYLEKMLHALAHRGPDDWGMAFYGFAPMAASERNVNWQECTSARLAFGHRRLAILDLSEAGRQPMTNRDATLTITFNGEIYNYIELRDELSRHITFHTGTDTEVLLAAYQKWGLDMLGRLDGMYAFALWDARVNKLICARDPLGIKPFYYAQDGERFYFASEPRAVLAGLGSSGHLDTAHIAEFLAFGISDYDAGTSYREVRQLCGGQWLEVTADGRVSLPQTFWQPPAEELEADEDVPEFLRAQLEMAVKRQLRSDVPVGSCLSGGLDSGSIVTAVSNILSVRADDFMTFTLANKDFSGDESELARITAHQAGVCWNKVETDIEAVPGALSKLIQTVDEPIGGLSVLGQYQVMQYAHRQGIKVMLDGQGGDEVFLGYPRVAQCVAGEYWKQGRISSALSEWHALAQNASQPLATSLLGNLFFRSPRLASWRNRRRIRDLVSSEVLACVRPETIADLYGNESVHTIQRRELTRYILPRLLRYEDRNSMAFGIEARVPLLTVQLVEYALRLPLRWRVRGGWTKYALRVAMQDRLPPEITWQRQKRGFEVPQRRWVAAAWPQIAARLAELPRECPINITAIQKCVEQGQGGEQWFWRCLSVALWMQVSGVRI